MASLVEELVSILNKEQALYEELTEIGKRKTEIIVAADISALEELTAIEQEKSDELLSYGNKQIQILNDIKNVLGKSGEKITVTTLIGFLSSQPKVQQELTVARDNLVASAKQMQSVNLQNEMLLKQAIEMTEFDITLFKSMRQAPETANYNKNALNTGAILGNSGFDARQ
uniref:flagellar protein FlgN n=1 Tax=Agathobacter sp. TaxID=2021311 RepID=UPI00405763F8